VVLCLTSRGASWVRGIGLRGLGLILWSRRTKGGAYEYVSPGGQGVFRRLERVFATEGAGVPDEVLKTNRK